MPPALRSFLALLASAVLLCTPALGYDTPLSEQAVREAYFLGQRRDESNPFAHLLGGKRNLARGGGLFDGTIRHLRTHRASGRERTQSRRNIHFRSVKTREINSRMFAGILDYHVIRCGQLVERARHQIRIHFEPRLKLSFEVFARRVNVALVGHSFE